MKMWRDSRLVAAAFALALGACVAGADAHGARDAASADREPSAVSPSQGASQQVELGALPAGAIRFTVSATGNTARYRVREQLMGRDLLNDAIGETEQITGAITVSDAGALIPGQSRYIVRTSALESDSERRDGYVRRRLLESDQHPTVELVPTALRGLPPGLTADATTGPITFHLIGDLSVRGVTRPTTWRVTARQAGGQLTGTASTKFTFADFGISPPRVTIVLSVADTIGLEYDFAFTRDPSE